MGPVAAKIADNGLTITRKGAVYRLSSKGSAKLSKGNSGKKVSVKKL